MSKYQQEIKTALAQQQEFKAWKIRTSGGDILIKVPEDTDIVALEQKFPMLIAAFLPFIETEKSSFKFYVGRSGQTEFIYTLSQD